MASNAILGEIQNYLTHVQDIKHNQGEVRVQIQCQLDATFLQARLQTLAKLLYQGVEISCLQVGLR